MHLIMPNPEMRVKPENQEIREALSGNLCRCTGYIKILDAIESATKEMRVERVPPSHRDLEVEVRRADPERGGLEVLSWVRESHAHLDTPLWRAVSAWLESAWPFASVQYAPRA